MRTYPLANQNSYLHVYLPITQSEFISTCVLTHNPIRSHIYICVLTHYQSEVISKVNLPITNQKSYLHVHLPIKQSEVISTLVLTTYPLTNQKSYVLVYLPINQSEVISTCVLTLNPIRSHIYTCTYPLANQKSYLHVYLPLNQSEVISTRVGK